MGLADDGDNGTDGEAPSTRAQALSVETISACDPSGGLMVARGSNATMVTSDGGGWISACDPGGTTETGVGSGQLGTISAWGTQAIGTQSVGIQSIGTQATGDDVRSTARSGTGGKSAAAAMREQTVRLEASRNCEAKACCRAVGKWGRLMPTHQQVHDPGCANFVADDGLERGVF